jgi:tetratricopeptide (TPR) repeat protein
MNMCCKAVTGVLFLAAVTFCQSPQQQIESHARQAQEYLKTNRPDLAAREFQAIVALDPDNADARGNLGVLLFFQGNYAKAAPELRAALKLRPGLWKIQALLGMCEKRIGEAAAARADLEQAFPQLREEKLRVQTGLELVEVYIASSDLDKAAVVVGTLRDLRPTDTEILYTAHQVYASLSDETLLAVALTAPKSARMHQLMAHEMVRQGNISGAIAQLREAIRIDPRLPGLRFELAEALNSSKEASEQAQAESEYQAALAANPFDEKAHCRLGEFAFGRSDLKAAFAHYSRAVELQPNDADANLGLAKVLLAMDEPAKAQALLERSTKLEPYNSVTRYHLAAAYRNEGRMEDARREIAEFKRLKEMKENLRKLYQEMRVEPAGQERPDPAVPQ